MSEPSLAVAARAILPPFVPAATGLAKGFYYTLGDVMSSDAASGTRCS